MKVEVEPLIFIFNMFVPNLDRNQEKEQGLSGKECLCQFLPMGMTCTSDKTVE